MRRFGLLADETPAHGLQRTALSQLDLAIRLLRDEADALDMANIAPEEAVHETRKAFKRLRALMRLLEGELGPGTTRRELTVLRDAGRRLAGARDAEVMVATIDDVLRRGPRKLRRRRGAIELRAHLERERRLAARRLASDVTAREQVSLELSAMRARVQMWRLPERLAIELAEPGLKRIYRTGRRAHRQARAHPSDALAMHMWRKHAKELRYALEALDVEGGANRPSGRIGRLAHKADALGELLGEDHDLVVLAQQIRAYKPLRRHRRTRKQLLRAIARRRAQLRKRAMRLGAPLYEHKPARFVRRLHT